MYLCALRIRVLVCYFLEKSNVLELNCRVFVQTVLTMVCIWVTGVFREMNLLTRQGRRSWGGKVGTCPPTFLLDLYWYETSAHSLFTPSRIISCLAHPLRRSFQRPCQVCLSISRILFSGYGLICRMYAYWISIFFTISYFMYLKQFWYWNWCFLCWVFFQIHSSNPDSNDGPQEICYLVIADISSDSTQSFGCLPNLAYLMCRHKWSLILYLHTVISILLKILCL